MLIKISRFTRVISHQPVFDLIKAISSQIEGEWRNNEVIEQNSIKLSKSKVNG